MPAINRCSVAPVPPAPPANRLVSRGIPGIQRAGVVRNTPNRKRLKAQPYTSPPTEPLIDRGFTFHEHLYPFTLINMNGRAYDPLVGRFLSADPYIQAPDNTQNLNRYSYCLNNTLRYSDPSGEFIIEAMIIGGLANWIMGGCDFNAEGLLNLGLGAASGIIGAGVTNGVTSLMMGGGFVEGALGTCMATETGFLSGFAGGFASGLVSGTASSLIQGNNIGNAIGYGFSTGATNGLFQGLSTGISALIEDRKFLTGKSPYYLAKLEDYSLVHQSDKKNCKNATMETIEEMNGGVRTQADFKKDGDVFEIENPKASLDDYFKHFGFNVDDVSDWSYKQIGTVMRYGNPVVIEEKIGSSNGHTLLITKLKQWTSDSPIEVWFADPQRGHWKTLWKNMVSPEFCRGSYLFWIH
ncbi:MAG TPA: hypothetical protein DEO70_05740 [Bacteroidales bacterium]|nr:MAG: hypothetical protein A2X11_10900 [Bacteroidetes bacterium GWE2_42_24]OFY32055.1 MAG: hypothetical protein A2X09_10465 [Bacteroidetes bacterium GWF2_43_11]HBZ66322.1 hypothetical protein [Bacteroidales bacterium]